MNIAIIQMNTDASPGENFRKASEEASKLPSSVVMLPELFTTGFRYDVIDSLSADHHEIISDLPEGHTYIGSIVRSFEGRRYNSLFVKNDTGFSFPYDKRRLFPLMDEHKHFTPGSRDGYFDIDGTLCAGAVCFDLRFPEITREYFRNGAKVMFLPAQWPLVRKGHIEALSLARAVENQCYFCVCNSAGDVGGTVFAGSSAIYGPWGEQIAKAGAHDGEVLTATLDISEVDNVRKTIPMY